MENHSVYSMIKVERLVARTTLTTLLQNPEKKLSLGRNVVLRIGEVAAWALDSDCFLCVLSQVY